MEQHLKRDVVSWDKEYQSHPLMFDRVQLFRVSEIEHLAICWKSLADCVLYFLKKSAGSQETISREVGYTKRVCDANSLRHNEISLSVLCSETVLLSITVAKELGCR